MIFEPYPMGLGGNFVTQQLILERLDRNFFYPIVVAPIEGVALDYFRKMGVECIVISPLGALSQYGGKALQDGVLGRLKSVINLFRYNFKIRKFILNNNIDLIYTNCVRAQLTIGIASLLSRTPAVLYIKGVLANPIIDRICYFSATKILFFCAQNRDDQYRFLTRLYRKKIAILEIGIDPQTLSEANQRDKTQLSSELSINSKYINIAVLAQLYRPKGQHFAIEAIARLVLDFPNIRLYLVGDHVIKEYEPYKRELESQIRKHNLTQHVFFTGWRKDALDIASLMDIIIHPSLAEGFGRAVLESMGLGKPVIASSVGGLRSAIIDGINGYLVEPGDVDLIELRMRKLLLNKNLRSEIGLEAQKTVISNYQIDDKIFQLTDIWKKTLTKYNN